MYLIVYTLEAKHVELNVGLYIYNYRIFWKLVLILRYFRE